ncbi:MAG: hypothetical protein K6G44_16290 [Lentisphaeria bacterium]|nr:hypothetical protein [Lentisphaeria bacterium]
MRKLFMAMMVINCFIMAKDTDWAFSPTITDGDPHLVELTVTPQNIALIGQSVDWLRLKDSKGKIVPFHVKEKTETVFSDEWTDVPSKVTQVRSLDSGALEILCEIMEKTPVPQNIHVSFVTSQRDFAQQVEVFGEQPDGWKSLLDNGFIFDSTRYLNVRNLDVLFSTAGCRRFRLLLSHATVEQRNALKSLYTKELADGETELSESTVSVEQPFKMDRIELWMVTRVASGVKTKLVKGLRYSMLSDIESDPNVDVVSFDPYVYPINGVMIETKDPDLNFSRKVSVYNWLGKDEEYFLCDAVIWRIKVNGFLQEETTILFPPVSEGMVVLKIDNGNNPWLGIESLTPLNPVYGLQFVARADRTPYHLTVEPFAKEPNYDVSDILALAGGKVEPIKVSLDNSMLKLGDDKRGAHRKSKITVISTSKRRVKRVMVIAALVVVVMAMAFTLLNVFKQEN